MSEIQITWVEACCGIFWMPDLASFYFLTLKRSISVFCVASMPTLTDSFPYSATSSCQLRLGARLPLLFLNVGASLFVAHSSSSTVHFLNVGVIPHKLLLVLPLSQEFVGSLSHPDLREIAAMPSHVFESSRIIPVVYLCAFLSRLWERRDFTPTPHYR